MHAWRRSAAPVELRRDLAYGWPVPGELVGLDRQSRGLRVRALALRSRCEGPPRESHAPEAEVAMKHEGSTIGAVRGEIGPLSALAGEPATPGGPRGAPYGLARAATDERRS